MINLIKDIDNIISDCNLEINDKIFGINYLEKLKYHLIDRLKKTNNYSYQDIKKKETKVKFGDNNLLIRVETYPDSFLKIKNTILNDNLSIVLEGIKTLEIYENIGSKKCSSVNLYKYYGITLPKDTIISESVSKDALLMNIINFKDDNNIEN